MWDSYFYKPGNGYVKYGYWYTLDMEKFEYFGNDKSYCIASRDKNTVTITNPFGSCPLVE